MKKYGYKSIILSLSLQILLIGCASSTDNQTNLVEDPISPLKQTQNVLTPEPVETPNQNVDSINLETKAGLVKFMSYEYITKGVSYDSNEVANGATILINFEYVNKETKPKEIQYDFWITAFQNGIELDGPDSYTPNQVPQSMKDYDKMVMIDTPLTIGVAYHLQDYTPVSIMVNTQCFDSSIEYQYQIMELNIEEPS